MSVVTKGSHTVSVRPDESGALTPQMANKAVVNLTEMSAQVSTTHRLDVDCIWMAKETFFFLKRVVHCTKILSL